jgi:hypothetical protein
MHVGWLHDYWTIEYLLGREAGKRYSPFNGTVCTVLPASPPNGARIVVAAAPEADDWRTPSILQRLYPNAKRTTVTVLGDRFPMVVYDVPPRSSAQVEKSTQVEFGGVVRLLNSQYSPQDLEAGKPLLLDLVWETIKSTDVPYKLFVHLLGAPKSDGSILYAQYDGEPCARLWHTNIWRPGELLYDTYSLRTPVNLPTGDYALEIGWYTETTSARLPIGGADATAFDLAQFSVR